MGGQPVKKILVNARGLSTQEVEVKSLHIRTIISINREGVTAFAVFLLSLNMAATLKYLKIAHLLFQRTADTILSAENKYHGFA